VIGSLIVSVYGSRITELPPLPASAHAGAEASIGAANGVAAGLPAAQAAQVIESSGSAYTDALGIGLAVAVAIALTAAVVVKRRLPARHLPVEAAISVKAAPSGARAR
jgi:hypothetical protein